MSNASHIPNQFIFVWDDVFFPYPAYLAIKSAAVQCQPKRILLLKTPQLDGVENFERLRRELPCLEPVDIDLEGWLEEARLSCSKELLAAYSFLKKRRFHGSVSDLLRTLKLYLEGGIYLDTDTLTLRDLAPLRSQGGFVAEEHILVTSAVYKRASRWRYLRTGPLTAVRHLCSRLPFGEVFFLAIAPLYARAVHNAVMGFCKGHQLPKDMLLRIAENYPRRPERYPLLGPDTVQDLMAERRYPDVTVYPPRCFSPLGPTMTYQYFHLWGKRHVNALARRVVRPDTHVVHWSNNATIARSIPRNDDELRDLADKQLFARLALQAAFGPCNRSE
ncbi:MAG: hypothetical protein GXP54_08680 [Deltaproteobacteria bacterium]|nr:hypothetical protein [Deltaproteobacteria bacterium]